MALRPFETLLRTSIGLEAASIGPSAIERAVRERLDACRLDNPEAYWHRVCSSTDELQALIEAVVVPETWFFRDEFAFASLGTVVKEMIASGPASRVVRVLSVPCATGEEPYSIAMALLDAGVPADRFRVHAVDVSQRALDRGRAGVYGKGAFRGGRTDFLLRHFTRDGGAHRIGDHVRAQVAFRHGNILEPGTLAAASSYDVIFCRNLLIYFGRAVRGRAIETLSGLLAADGLLLVGAAEAALLADHGFVQASIPKAHAFRRRRAGDGRPHPSSAPARPARPARPRRGPERPAPAVPRAPDATPAERARPAVARASLDDAHRLANQGRFAEAIHCCEDVLRAQGPSAEAFHLLGLLHDAGGDCSLAITCYRKALYLDPSHYDTMAHLAVLMHAQNNEAEAQVLRERMRRLEQRGARR